VDGTQKIKTQETSKLQTTIQLNAGETIEIGSVLKNLTDQASKIDVNSGATIDQTNIKQNEKILLSID
jgi:predicted nucleotidyltransferase